MSFNAEKELAKIKSHRKSVRKKRYSKSRLDKFSFEIFELKKAGASLADIQLFLKKQRVKVVLSTIQRWLKNHE
jgi:hypothetical protein